MVTFVEFLEYVMTPSKTVFLIGACIVLFLPVLMHYLIVSATPYTALPSVLLLGPANAGKTAFLTLLENGDQPAQTHTSQLPQSVEFTASSDPEIRMHHDKKEDPKGSHTKFLVVDAPGHPKLRSLALRPLLKLFSSQGQKKTLLPAASKAMAGPSNSAHAHAHADIQKVKGIVFFVDSSSLSEQSVLSQTAEYLYDVLLLLQKRTMSTKTSRAPYMIPVLIAANKTDLFTALPASAVRRVLAEELTSIRQSRSRSLLDSGAAGDEALATGGFVTGGEEEEDSWLGSFGTESFDFNQMQEFDVYVDVLGGNVVGEGTGVNKWWAWMTDRVL